MNTNTANLSAETAEVESRTDESYLWWAEQWLALQCLETTDATGAQSSSSCPGENTQVSTENICITH